MAKKAFAKKIVPTSPVCSDPDDNMRRVVAWAVKERGQPKPIRAVAEPGSAVAPQNWIWTPVKPVRGRGYTGRLQ